MKTKQAKKPILLAPVRDEISFTAAIDAGADAVYFGIGELNMRLSSKGINLKQLPRFVKKAHQKNVLVYITLNVIIYENELKKLEQILKQIKKSGADAVIVSDFAAITLCQKFKIPFHLSTQVNISNSSEVKFFERLGAKAVVLARECTLPQIKEIKKKSKIKIEIFIHGAMCVSVSGRCYMSEFTSCKSANRGECMQPCRREYEIRDTQTGDELVIGKGFVMSPKDLCTLQILDKVIATGVDILKIEGRSRSPEYIKTVVSAYRTAIDAIANKKYSSKLADELVKQVSEVYNRGFSTGFLFGVPGSEGWAKISGTAAKIKKERLGYVRNYYRQSKIGEIYIEANPVKAGDKIQIEGPTTGVIDFILPEFWVNDKPTTSAKLKDIITFKSPLGFRRNDKAYIIKKI
ncbi:MAG TPA: peptidase U32 family protein [Candidatus Magasanikbacteria bacterium]|nr:peptidase U32 family protein [Candidatus Magasanikbacteria bacterium]